MSKINRFSGTTENTYAFKVVQENYVQFSTFGRLHNSFTTDIFKGWINGGRRNFAFIEKMALTGMKTQKHRL